MKNSGFLKKICKVLLVPAMLVAMVAPAQAATRDFVNIKTGERITAANWRTSEGFSNLLTILSDETQSPDYAVEFGKKLYSYNGLLEAITTKKPAGLSTNDAFVKALTDTSLIVQAPTEPTNPDDSEDLDVISIE